MDMEMRTKSCSMDITLAEDKMSAGVKLCPDAAGSQWTLEDMEKELNRKGICSGIDREALCRMLEHDLYGIEVEVAKGKPPVKGTDGYFVFHVEEPTEEKQPKEMEDGSVEYIHTTQYAIVNEGDLLAEYIPATAGENGWRLDGTVCPAVKGKELLPMKGKGFRVENNRYYAVKHGKVEITGRTLVITNMLEVKGDVDINYGHIQFDGDVYIRGDVKSGMMIRATGNVEIRGHVGNCYIEAGKDLILSNGMQGKFSGRLKAGGNITCKFFENSQARAEGNITLRTAMNSKLTANGKVTIEGKGAAVIGGSVYAVQGMELAQAGNENEISTLLVAGVMPETTQKNTQLIQQIKKVQEEIDLLERSGRILDRMKKSNATLENSDRRRKIIQAKIIKTTELKTCQNEKVKVEALLQRGQDAEIIVHNVIYPGCRVEIAGCGMDMKEKVKHIRFVLQDGRVEGKLLY